MTNERIEPWARESEEKRLEEIIKGMKERGVSNTDVCNYLCKVTNRYLAELDGFLSDEIEKYR